MAIIKGAINFGSNFNIGAKGPIDARQRVETIADLTTVWTAEIPAYKGMVVSVLEDNSIYILKADDATVFDNWKKVGDVTGDITNLQEQITANKDAIDVINGDANTEGSFKKGDADTLAAAKADATTKADAVKGSDTDDAGAATVYGANKAAAAAKDAADAASAKVDTEIGKLNSTVNNEATSAGDAVSTQIKVTVEETKGKLTGVTVNAPSFESAGASAAVKTELLGETGVPGNTIISAKEDAAAASAKVDAEIGKLDVTGNTSDAVKGVTVTVDETDGKVIKPVVSIANGTLTGAATDGNLVTGTAVKKYVDDKVSEINTAAGELGTRVTTLEGRVNKLDATHTTKDDGSFNTVAEEVTTGIAGIAETSKANTAGSDVVVTVTTKSGSVSSVAVDSSVLKKAVTDGDDKVKTDLIGDAAAEYNTLGKLEDKIQEEASTARAEEKKNADAIAAETTRATAAEKKNADAAAAAKTAADNAQATADAKVKSVEGTNTVIATTTKHAVSVSLKTSDKGNVKFTQDADGLSANVTIPEATVTGVKADDKFLSLADKLVSADVSIAYDATDKKIYLYGKDKNKANAVSSIDCTDFIKDGMLDGSALYTATAATGTVTINSKEYALTGLTAGHAYIVLVWNTDAEKAAMAIDVTSLIDIYTAKADGGLKLEDHAFSVDYEKVAKKGDLDNEITRAKAAEKANADAIAAEKSRATEAEAALLGTDTDTKDSVTIKGAKKAVEDLKAQIEADAVTLTIPEDDPYITASKDGNTNRYTISSKKDGTTPLVDVKIDAKLTDKINSLDVTGNKSEAVAGIAVTVNETDGKVSKPEVSVTPGEVAAGNASVVTGDAVYTAVDDAKSALIGTDADTKDSDTIKGAKKYTDDALVWHDIA